MGTGTRGWGRRLTHCRRSPSHPPHAPTTGRDHASSYGHEGDGGDVSPIVADLRPIPLMPRQPAEIMHHRTGTRGMGATSHPSSQISVPSPSCPDNRPRSCIIVRARGGWGRRLTHRRRSPSHPPHAPTTGQYHDHRTGTRGMGATSRPLSQISVPSPSCPDNRPRSCIIVRARGGWGRRLTHCRRSPSHPPHAPTTGRDHASSYGHEGDGGDVSPIVADLRPIPLMPRQPAQDHEQRTGTRGMGATSRPLSQISVPSPSCPDNRFARPVPTGDLWAKTH